MSVIHICDSCGEITTEIAARMYVEINPQHLRSDVMKQMLDSNSGISANRSTHTMADASKDLCVNCLAKFMEQKAPKILLAEAVKDL